MLKKAAIFFIFLLCAFYVSAQLRAFHDIYPGINDTVRAAVFSNSGYFKSSQAASGYNLIPNAINPQILNTVLDKNPFYLVESISIIPAEPGKITLLDIYNALGNIRDLKGRLYNSYSKSQSVPLFEDATRIRSEKQNTPIPDPPPVNNVPLRDTVYIRLKDANFGNSFYRADLLLVQNGLCYILTNFKSLNYLFIPVIKEGNFTAMLYLEPIKEGVLIYGIVGADISDFFASRIHINSAIAKRLEVITSWAVDGISKTKR